MHREIKFFPYYETYMICNFFSNALYRVFANSDDV
jgi:hypothetical protein